MRWFGVSCTRAFNWINDGYVSRDETREFFPSVLSAFWPEGNGVRAGWRYSIRTWQDTYLNYKCLLANQVLDSQNLQAQAQMNIWSVIHCLTIQRKKQEGNFAVNHDTVRVPFLPPPLNQIFFFTVKWNFLYILNIELENVLYLSRTFQC